MSVTTLHTKVYIARSWLQVSFMSRKSCVKANEGAHPLRTVRHFRNNNQVTPQNSCLPFHLRSAVRYYGAIWLAIVDGGKLPEVWWRVREDHHIFRVSLVTHSLHPSFKCAAWTGSSSSQRQAELVHYVRFVRATSPLVQETRVIRACWIRKLLYEENPRPSYILFLLVTKESMKLEEILSSHAIIISHHSYSQ